MAIFCDLCGASSQEDYLYAGVTFQPLLKSKAFTFYESLGLEFNEKIRASIEDQLFPKICSLHFDEDQFIHKSKQKHARRFGLKPDAVPRYYLQKRQELDQRIAKRKKIVKREQPWIPEQHKVEPQPAPKSCLCLVNAFEQCSSNRCYSNTAEGKTKVKTEQLDDTKSCLCLVDIHKQFSPQYRFYSRNAEFSVKDSDIIVAEGPLCLAGQWGHWARKRGYLGHTVPCPICNKWYVPELLSEHIADTTKSKCASAAKLYRCYFCDAECTRNQIGEHVFEEHEQIGPFGLSYSPEEQPHALIDIDGNVGQLERWLCHLCGFMINGTKQQIHTHFTIVHEQDLNR